MAEEDKLMGIREGQKVYASHRIDIDTEEDVRFQDGDTGAIEERFTDAVKSPAPGHEDHPVKDGYQRKLIVETVDTMNEVVNHLDSEGIAYIVEPVEPTQEEIDAIEEWGAETGAEVKKAKKWDTAVKDLDRGDITVGEYMRGKNTSRGTEFEHPKRGRNK